jgi:hypothetical protein
MRLLALLLAVSAYGQTPADFTGHWRQQTDSGVQRQLDVEQSDRSLFVKTTVSNAQGNRSLAVKYEIGGPATTYTGLDGDEFRSSVRWDGNTLVFDTIEREDGKELPETTMWTLAEGRDSLEVRRQSTKSGKARESLTTYVRQP